MTFECPCDITFTPAGGSAITLAAAGSWLRALPAIEAAQDMFEREGVFLSAAVFVPLGGARVTITFETEDAAETHAGAQAGFLNAEREDGEELTGLTGTLAFVTAGQTATYPAVIGPVRPGLPSGGESARSRRFEIWAGLPAVV